MVLADNSQLSLNIGFWEARAQNPRSIHSFVGKDVVVNSIAGPCHVLFADTQRILGGQD